MVNADRRRQNPNLLWKGDELFVFDHETVFAFTRLIGESQKPFEYGAMRFLHDHPLYAGMRGQPIDLSRFIGELEGLRDSRIDELLDAIPSDFGKEYVEKIR